MNTSNVRPGTITRQRRQSPISVEAVVLGGKPGLRLLCEILLSPLPGATGLVSGP